MPESLTYATFSERLGDAFQVRLGDTDTVAVELIEATSRSQPAPVGPGDDAPRYRGDSFSIMFQGRADRLLAQGTYQFEHHQMEPFPLFIVPIGATDQGIRYEAVFNRLTH